MRTSAATLAITFFVLCLTAAAQQSAQTVVRGDVTDSSGGFLPGVTVVATTPEGRILATAVTDSAGRYVFRKLPVGSVRLTFQLEGFTTTVRTVDVKADAESRVAARLEVAPHSETVVVQAESPVDPESPRYVPAIPAAPVIRPVPDHDAASVCGPAKPSGLPEALGTIIGSRSTSQLDLYSAGAELVLDRGQLDGLEVGRNLVVRRHYQVRGTSADATGEHTAGLVQIVAAAEHSSVAVVVYACDELRKGDFLASFKPERVRIPDPVGIPAFYDAARILFGDEGQMLGAPRRQMVIDRGTNHGTRVGQRFTLFRQGRAGRRNVVGDAVVVAVRTDSATIRVDRLIDAIAAGDWAAPQAATSAALQRR